MESAGKTIAVTAGVLGVLSALFTLLIGGFGRAVNVWGTVRIVDFGLGGIVFSLLVIWFASEMSGRRSLFNAGMVVVCALLAAALGGRLVRWMMMVALAGALIGLTGALLGRWRSSQLEATTDQEGERVHDK